MFLVIILFLVFMKVTWSNVCILKNMFIGNYWWLCVSSANSYWGNKTFGKVATIGWKHIAMNFYENYNGSFFWFNQVLSCTTQMHLRNLAKKKWKMKTLCFNPTKKISRISIDREDHNIYKGSNLTL